MLKVKISREECHDVTWTFRMFDINTGLQTETTMEKNRKRNEKIRKEMKRVIRRAARQADRKKILFI